jgi:hypothetical protein
VCNSSLNFPAFFRASFGAYTTTLTSAFFIEVNVRSQENERSRICVLVVSIITLFLRFIDINLGNVPTVWYFFIFHFYFKFDIIFYLMHIDITKR